MSGETLECAWRLCTAVSLFPDQPCWCAICHYYSSTIWRRSASKVIRACCIFSVLIPSQVPVHYSSSNIAERTVYIITVKLVRAVCWESVLLHILQTPTFPKCFHLSYAGWVKGKRIREKLTVSWNDPQRHRVSSLFDQVDDIWVGLIGDGAAIYSQDPVSNF